MIWVRTYHKSGDIDIYNMVIAMVIKLTAI